MRYRMSIRIPLCRQWQPANAGSPETAPKALTTEGAVMLSASLKRTDCASRSQPASGGQDCPPYYGFASVPTRMDGGTQHRRISSQIAIARGTEPHCRQKLFRCSRRGRWRCCSGLRLGRSHDLSWRHVPNPQQRDDRRDADKEAGDYREGLIDRSAIPPCQVGKAIPDRNKYRERNGVKPIAQKAPFVQTKHQPLDPIHQQTPIPIYARGTEWTRL